MHMSTDRMSAGELRTIREWLGLSRADLARILEIGEGTLEQWERGNGSISYRAGRAVRDLDASTLEVVERLAEKLDRIPHDEMGDVVRAFKDPEMPPRWWRHVVSRVCHELPAVTLADLDL